MLPFVLAVWGCIPELAKDCQDMTNASSTYLGVIIGAAIGGAVSWWIYNRQQKTSDRQDHLMAKIKDLEEKHSRLLKKIEKMDEGNDVALKKLLELDSKIGDLLAKKGEG
jgi:Na+/glutamate symporter